MFETLSDRLESVFTSLRGKGRLSEADIDATAREIRIALLEADVALPVVREFIAAIKTRAAGAEVSQALNPAQQVIKIVNEELVTILGGEARPLHLAKMPPTVVLLAGLQGTGKTTLAGKLGRWLKEQRHVPLLVASDLQRPNAVQQLQVVGGQAGVDVFAPEPGNGIGDPVAVARAGVEHARRMGHDVVVVDTAGRLGIDADLMAQAAAIRDAVQPDETLFVVDAMVGQDAVNTAEAFRDGVGFTGVVLTKLDGDARGGAALSVAKITGCPIMFASTGEKLDDFDVFHPERMASRILGMGDVLTLIEQAEKTFEADETARMAEKMLGPGELTLEDFLEQMMMVRRMGPIGNILGMLPGMGQIKEQISQIDDRDLDRIAAIIRSMTPSERQDPKVLNGSRRLRIARGSGVTVTEVNSLVDRFFEARKMMKQMTNSMPGMRRAAKRAGKKGKKGKGGKAGGRPTGAPRMPGALPAGAGGLPAGFDPSSLRLPPGMKLPPGLNPDLSNLRLPESAPPPDA
ncbi:MAG: signal recognition particle subunit [Frankiaceae bacterium]|jgi:signal recognition particle subunit SRP54|nr:signal recognition particle subunit [Frankiaceae bacterium]